MATTKSDVELREAFKMFDRDRDGTITIDELKTFLSDINGIISIFYYFNFSFLY